MFKPTTVIRRRVMQHVDAKLREAEQEYASKSKELEEKHGDEFDALVAKHHNESIDLLDGIVHKIVSKIL